MRYEVVHTTEYEYIEPVTLCHNEAHLKPRAHARQSVLSHQIAIDPLPAVMDEREDFFGNPVLYFAIQASHLKLSVTGTSQVELDGQSDRPHRQSTITWQEAAQRTLADKGDAAFEARQFVLDSPMVAVDAASAQFAADSFQTGRTLADAVNDLMGRIHTEFTYDPTFSTVATPLTQVFEHRRGVCQDFAHLAIACLRSHGLAARYVSGYIETLPPPGQQKLIGSDASHAWFSVFDPDFGWLDFDPTNNQIPIDQHITTAWGRDYADITPLKGVIFGGGAGHTTNVAVTVTGLNGQAPADGGGQS